MELLNKSFIREVAQDLDLEVPVDQAVQEIEKVIGQTQVERLRDKSWRERRDLATSPSFWRDLVRESAEKAGLI